MSQETQETKKRLIITNSACYDVEVFKKEETVPEYGKAYILREDYGDDDIFYIYQGVYKENSVEPGIYKTKDGFYEFVSPTDEQRKDFIVKTHLASMEPGDMIAILKDKKNIKHVYSENSRLYTPPINKNDNILKRALKHAFAEKEVSIESCKSGFSDRNAFFNFSSVMKSDTGNITFLLMDRGCEALNLGYAVILYEKDPDNPVGKSLEDPEIRNTLRKLADSKEPFVITSEEFQDVYEAPDAGPMLSLDGKILVTSEDSFDV